MNETNIENLKKKMLEIKVIGGNVNNITFKDLTEIINLLKNQGQNQEAEKLVRNYYQENKSYILYSFCLGVFLFYQQKEGDQFITNFYNQLIKIGKNNLLNLISLEILKIYESEFVLNYLINDYQKSNKKDELMDIWKRLLSKKPDDINLILKIAEEYNKNNPDEALKYFQLALLKECDNKSYLNALTIWRKILDTDLREYDLLIQLSKKFVDYLSLENKSSFYLYFLKNLEKDFEKNYDYIIKVFKLSLESDTLLKNQFSKLIESYRIKYQNHNNFETITNLAGIKNLYRNANFLKTAKITETIKDFEKHIIFDEGRFVQHRNFGIGVIKKIMLNNVNTINDAKLVIDFKQRRNHEMSFRIAINSLSILDPNNLEAIALFEKEKLTEIKKDNLILLNNILKTTEPPVNLKTLNELMVEKIKLFEKNEWKKKWNEIKKAIVESNEFEITKKGVQFKALSISLDESTLNFLKKTTDIKEKIKTLEFYYNHKSQVDKEVNNAIVTELLNLAKKPKVGSLAFISFLYYLKNTKKEEITFDFDHYFKNNFNQPHLEEEFNSLNSFALKEIFIILWYNNFKTNFLNQVVDNWLVANISNKEYLFNFLLTQDKDLLIQIFNVTDNDYLKYNESYFLLVKFLLNLNDSVIKDRVGSAMLKLLKINADLYKNINIKKDSRFSKKLYGAISNYLFKENYLFSLLKSKDLISLDDRKAIFVELENQTFLENYLKVEIRTLREFLKK